MKNRVSTKHIFMSKKDCLSESQNQKGMEKVLLPTVGDSTPNKMGFINQRKFI